MREISYANNIHFVPFFFNDKDQLTWKHIFAVFMKENVLEIVKLVVMKKISMQNYRMNMFYDNLNSVW